MSARGHRSRRAAPGPTRVLGRRAALEAVHAGLAREVLVSDAARSTPGLRELLEAGREAGVAIRRVPEATLERTASGGRHQGVVTLVGSPPSLDLAGLAARRWDEDAMVLVLDGVTDPQNLGACARSAEAAGVAALVTRRHRGAPVTPSAVRSSAGALLHLPVATVPNITAAIDRLRSVGFWVVGLDGAAPGAVGSATRPPGRLALVAGDEGKGLSRLVREGCDELLSIPLRGRVASLNVSAAVAVALYGYALESPSPSRERRTRPPG